MSPPETAEPDRPVGLPLRLAAMTYEGVLLFGVTFAVAFALLTALGWTYPLSPFQRVVLQGALFAAIGIYFVWCWTRSGQTLALKTWKLRVATTDGSRVSTPRAIARYLLSWHLFVPGLIVIALDQPGPVASLTALALSFGLLLLPALWDPERRLLHDRWTRTRVQRDR
ncbi:MAG: RDD family protein [Betaproteobacteria bacterium]